MQSSRHHYGTRAILTGLLVGGLALSAPAWAKTHDIAMTAVESDVVIDGSGE